MKKDVETDGASAGAYHILPALVSVQLQQLLRGGGIPIFGGTQAVAAAIPGRSPAEAERLGGEVGLPLQKKPRAAMSDSQRSMPGRSRTLTGARFVTKSLCCFIKRSFLHHPALPPGQISSSASFRQALSRSSSS